MVCFLRWFSALSDRFSLIVLLQVMKEAEVTNLLDFGDFNTNDLGGPGSGSGGSGSGGSGGMVDPPGFRGYPGPPLLPSHAMSYPVSKKKFLINLLRQPNKS